MSSSNRIVLLSRALSDGVSIQKVFKMLLPYLNKYDSVEEVFIPHVGLSLKSILANLRTAFRVRRTGDVVHITGAVHYLSYVLCRDRTITTVHDLGMLSRGNCLCRFMLRQLFLHPLKRNRFLICISQNTKEELLSYINYPKERIFVIPDPVAPQYKHSQKTFNAQTPKILHIGTKENKNLGRTACALQGIPCLLRIVGKPSNADETLLKKNKIRYEVLGRLSEQELLEEYIASDIVNFPSTYEGFGMPIIEAQAIGRVCVTSDMEPMKSVAGKDGAVLVNPFDVDSIREGYISVISNPQLRKHIIAAGLENASKYSAECVAVQYTHIYNLMKSV